VSVINPVIPSGRVSFTPFRSGSPDLQPLSPKPEPYFRIEEVAVVSPLALSGRVSFTPFPSGSPDLQPLSPKPEPSPPESHQGGGCYTPPGLALSGTASRFSPFPSGSSTPLCGPESHHQRSGGRYRFAVGSQGPLRGRLFKH